MRTIRSRDARTEPARAGLRATKRRGRAGSDQKRAQEGQDHTEGVRSANGNAVLEGAVRNIFAKDRSAIEIALERAGSRRRRGRRSKFPQRRATTSSEKKSSRRFADTESSTVFDDAGAIVKEGKVVLLRFRHPAVQEKPASRERMQNVLGIQEFENQIQVLAELAAG